MRATIIVGTRNRCASLAETLSALGGLRAPESPEVGLVVVDNGSNDETADVGKSLDLANLGVRYRETPICRLSMV